MFDNYVPAGPNKSCDLCGHLKQHACHFCDDCTARLVAGQRPVICTSCVLTQPKNLRAIAVTWQNLTIEEPPCHTVVILIDDCLACRKAPITHAIIDAETGVATHG